MRLRSRAPVRLCGLLLLVLAASPVTAPFSTYDLGDRSGIPAGHGSPAFKPKPAAEDPVAGVGEPGASGVRLSDTGSMHIPAAAALASDPVLFFPLRI